MVSGIFHTNSKYPRSRVYFKVRVRVTVKIRSLDLEKPMTTASPFPVPRSPFLVPSFRNDWLNIDVIVVRVWK